MPHLVLHFNPRDLNDAEIAVMAADLQQVLVRHLGTDVNAISLAINPVSADEWKEIVYDPLIRPALNRLYKAPGYSF